MPGAASRHRHRRRTRGQRGRVAARRARRRRDADRDAARSVERPRTTRTRLRRARVLELLQERRSRHRRRHAEARARRARQSSCWHAHAPRRSRPAPRSRSIATRFAALVTRVVERHPAHHRRARARRPTMPDGDVDRRHRSAHERARSSARSRRSSARDRLAFFDAAAPIVDGGVASTAPSCSPPPATTRAAGRTTSTAPMDRDEYERLRRRAARRRARRTRRSSRRASSSRHASRSRRSRARGRDALRFGAIKPVGLIDPRTGERPWAVVQLRPENAAGTAYNLVGFQTNLTFAEQRRVFGSSRDSSTPSSSATASCTATRSSTRRGCSRADLALRARSARPARRPAHRHRGLPRGGGARPGRRTRASCAALRRPAAGRAAAPRASRCAPRATRPTPRPSRYQPMHVNFGLVPPLVAAVARQARPLRRVRRARGRDRCGAWLDVAARPRRRRRARAPRPPPPTEATRHERRAPEALVDRFLDASRGRAQRLAQHRSRVRDRPGALPRVGGARRASTRSALDPPQTAALPRRTRRARATRGARSRAGSPRSASFFALPRRAGPRARRSRRGRSRRRSCPPGSRELVPDGRCSPRCSTRRTRRRRPASATARSSSCSTPPDVRVSEVEGLDLGGLDLGQGAGPRAGQREQGADRSASTACADAQAAGLPHGRAGRRSQRPVEPTGPSSSTASGPR